MRYAALLLALVVVACDGPRPPKTSPAGRLVAAEAVSYAWSSARSSGVQPSTARAWAMSR